MLGEDHVAGLASLMRERGVAAARRARPLHGNRNVSLALARLPAPCRAGRTSLTGDGEWDDYGTSPGPLSPRASLPVKRPRFPWPVPSRSGGRGRCGHDSRESAGADAGISFSPAGAGTCRCCRMATVRSGRGLTALVCSGGTGASSRAGSGANPTAADHRAAGRGVTHLHPRLRRSRPGSGRRKARTSGEVGFAEQRGIAGLQLAEQLV